MEGLDRAAAGALYPTVDATPRLRLELSLSKVLSKPAVLSALVIVSVAFFLGSRPAAAAPAAPTPPSPTAPAATATNPAKPAAGSASINLNLGDTVNKPSQ